MKLIRNFGLLIVFSIATAFSAFSQVDIISAKEFKTLIKNNKELVIIDASKSKKYKKAHIKNAISVQYGDLNKDEATNPKGMLEDPAVIAKFFGDLGISENSEIVVYDGGTQKYSSRIYFILKYIGAKNVKMTHQDAKQWAKNRLMVTSKVPKAKAAVSFTPTVAEDMIVALDHVYNNANNENVVLVDTRSAKEFIGEKKVIDGKFGYIPGSVHIHYKDFEVDGGAFKSKAQLEELATKYGLGADKEIIFFCKTGVKGAVAFNAFKNILGHTNVKLYEGGCAEYCLKYDLVK